MVDMEKVEKLTFILEERSGLGVREAVARSIHYLDGYESYLYSDEVKYLLELSMSRRSRRSSPVRDSPAGRSSSCGGLMLPQVLRSYKRRSAPL